MNEEYIKEYILRYENIYSKSQIITHLQNSGYKLNEINNIYNQISPNSKKIKILKIIIILLLLLTTLPIILGFLIFGLVDFGSLVPNQLEFSSLNFKGDVTSLEFISETRTLNLDLSYTGSQNSIILANNITITEGGNNCKITKITKNELNYTNRQIPVIYGNIISISANCNRIEKSSLFTDSEIIEGKISIITKNPKTNIEIPNFGTYMINLG